MRLGGGVPYFYPLTRENNFLPDVRSIPEAVARKAKVMLVSLPANPVGSVGTPELYAEIVAFCRAVRHLAGPRQRLQRHHL